MAIESFSSATLRLYKGTLHATSTTGGTATLSYANLLFLTTQHVQPFASPEPPAAISHLLGRREPRYETRAWLVDMTARQHAWAAAQMREIERDPTCRFRLCAAHDTTTVIEGGWVRQLSSLELGPRLTYGHALIAHTSETFVSTVCDKTETFDSRRTCEILLDLLEAERLPGL